jgi:hypothetical protein
MSVTHNAGDCAYAVMLYIPKRPLNGKCILCDGKTNKDIL